jgi:hypothetical protein
MSTIDPFVMKLLLGLFAVAVVIAFGAMLRWEWREFARRGKAAAWRNVRLAAIPIAALTAATIVVPTRSISGMEALGVFYLLLFTAAPLVWFGLHWLAGRMTRPALSFGDSFQLAVMLPAFAIAVSVVAHQLQPLAVALALDPQRVERAAVPPVAPPYAPTGTPQ